MGHRAQDHFIIQVTDNEETGVRRKAGAGVEDCLGRKKARGSLTYSMR